MEVGVCFRYARDIPGKIYVGGGESIGDVERANFRVWKFFNLKIEKSILPILSKTLQNCYAIVAIIAKSQKSILFLTFEI